MEERAYFIECYNNRIRDDSIKFWENPLIKKAYFIGAYARSVIISSIHSEVSKNNKTFKTWLSNQIINYRNLDRIFEMAFRFEQKLRLNIRNDSEVRRLAHQTPEVKTSGISSSKISYAFIAGFDDYSTFLHENPVTINDKGED